MILHESKEQRAEIKEQKAKIKEQTALRNDNSELKSQKSKSQESGLGFEFCVLTSDFAEA
jgi:hypothetical protein